MVEGGNFQSSTLYPQKTIFNLLYSIV